jgi:hypothetical protein
MTNDEGMKKPESGRPGWPSVIGHSFVIRHSSFVINPLFAEGFARL